MGTMVKFPVSFTYSLCICLNEVGGLWNGVFSNSGLSINNR